MSAIEEIAAERRRQIESEGWTPEHDDVHQNKVPDFYCSNEAALEDMKRLAEQETAASPTGGQE